ncbi:MAG: SMR family transporter [Pirellulaceae bacterium]
MILLAMAVRDLPIGIAYPAWVGIGSIGAAVVGILWLGESTSPSRILFLLLMVVAIIGLKASAAPPSVDKTEAVSTKKSPANPAGNERSQSSRSQPARSESSRFPSSRS